MLPNMKLFGRNLFKKRDAPKAMEAFSVAPGDFLEYDGNWCTFKFAVGKSPKDQNFIGVPSTSSFDIWLPTPDGCTTNASDPDSPKVPANCSLSRGVENYGSQTSNGYNDSNDPLARSGLGIENLDIGADNNAIFNLFGDLYNQSAGGTLALDEIFLSPSTAGTNRNSSGQVAIFGVRSWWYYLPSIGLGIGVRKTAVPNLAPIRSMISSMAAGGEIPGQSWGYTAGAFYGMWNSPFHFDRSLQVIDRHNCW
jgi:hypothetical protein